MADTSVDIVNTPEDYRAFSRVTRRRVGSIRYLPVAAGAVAAMAVLWGLPPLLQPYFLPYSDMPLILAVGVALILWFAIVFGLSRLTLSRSFDEGGLFREKKHVVVADDGIHVETAHTRSHVFWSAVKDVVTTPNHVFVMYDRASGMIVPRRCFASPAEAEAFASALRARIAARKAA